MYKIVLGEYIVLNIYEKFGGGDFSPGKIEFGVVVVHFFFVVRVSIPGVNCFHVVTLVLWCWLLVCVCGLPSARPCAVKDDNNKGDVCTPTIPAGLKCPPPSKTISLITWFEAYLNNLC